MFWEANGKPSHLDSGVAVAEEWSFIEKTKRIFAKS